MDVGSSVKKKVFVDIDRLWFIMFNSEVGYTVHDTVWVHVNDNVWEWFDSRIEGVEL